MAMEDLLSGIKPVPPDVRSAFENTDFTCECGGMVIPQSMEIGICFSCKSECRLENCDYTTDEL